MHFQPPSSFYYNKNNYLQITPDKKNNTDRANGRPARPEDKPIGSETATARLQHSFINADLW